MQLQTTEHLNAVSEVFLPKDNISTAMLNMWNFFSSSFSPEIATLRFHIGQIFVILIKMGDWETECLSVLAWKPLSWLTNISQTQIIRALGQ